MPISRAEQGAVDVLAAEAFWNHPGGKLRRLGAGACTEAELLAIILGSGSSGRSAEDIAEELIDRYGTVLDLMGVPLREIMKINGLKGVKVTQLAAVFEVTRRIVKHLEKR
ncbi:MAG: hypothetical protein HY372_03425 [Candidatus Andersenbacteria bacterium]|nr:hypothetical protein [Candidatus Andersenbacteria bacterium]